MGTKITNGQFLKFSSNKNVEGFDTGVANEKRLGVRAPDLETLWGDNSDSPATYTAKYWLKSILTAIGTTNGKDFATETTLAAILTKIIAAPATEAKQDTSNTALAAVLTALTTDGIKKIIDAVDISDRAGRALGKVTTDDGGSATIGAKADTAITDPTATASQIALLKGLLKQLQGTGTGNQNVYIADTGITLPTDKQGILKSEVTYTATALGANSTYTGSWIPVSTMRRLLILVNADQTGSLYIEHSRDGSAARRVTTVAITASTPKGLEEICYSSYARVVYTNGATAQGSFELSVMTSAD
jgi:hypothetical protein